MKRNEIKKVREMNDKQLKDMIDKTKQEIDNAKLDIKLGKEKNLKKSRNKRKELAVLLTIKREKEFEKKISKKE